MDSATTAWRSSGEGCAPPGPRAGRRTSRWPIARAGRRPGSGSTEAGPRGSVTMRSPRAAPALALAAFGLVAGCQHASAGGPASAAVAAPPGQVVVEERREAFVLADIDGDGCISLAELAREMAWRFAGLGANHADVLTPDELGGQDPARFARLDRDGDGRLTSVEVMQAKEADFAKADKAKTGCVTVVEVLEFDGLEAGK